MELFVDGVRTELTIMLADYARSILDREMEWDTDSKLTAEVFEQVQDNVCVSLMNWISDERNE
jgi:hypothetical protein